MDTLKFKQLWRNLLYTRIEKSDALTADELKAIRDYIKNSEEKGKMASEIISSLRKQYPKLKEKYNAERAYWTEIKRDESKEIKSDAKELEISKFKIIPSPNACPICMAYTGNGEKIFNRGDMLYKGRAVPPIHPNCYCLAVPYVD